MRTNRNMQACRSTYTQQDSIMMVITIITIPPHGHADNNLTAISIYYYPGAYVLTVYVCEGVWLCLSVCLFPNFLKTLCLDFHQKIITYRPTCSPWLQLDPHSGHLKPQNLNLLANSGTIWVEAWNFVKTHIPESLRYLIMPSTETVYFVTLIQYWIVLITVEVRISNAQTYTTQWRHTSKSCIMLVSGDMHSSLTWSYKLV